jgi:sterol desaturase/sphingolipid hydroxylase (fatty acid hydroxylase superfamily)
MKSLFARKYSFFFDSYLFSLVAVVLVMYLFYAKYWPALFLIAGGIVIWSLVEYSLHRWVLHGIMLKDHWPHHRDPEQYIGAPNYISITAFITLWLSLSIFFSQPVVAGWLLGVILGYLYYLFVHTMIHHTIIYPNGFLYRVSEHHHCHHHYSGGNYGVSTRVWDRVLQTVL